MSHPMICSVSGQNHSPTARMRGPPRAPVGRIAQQHAGRTVAEQCGGNKHRRAWIVDTQAETAQIDGEEQHMRAFARMRQARCTREAGDTAAAAEAKYRQAFDTRRKLEAIAQFGVKARDRKSGDCVRDKDVDRIEPDPGCRRRLERHLRQKIESMLLKRSRALFPAMRLEIPIDRLAIVANARCRCYRKASTDLSGGEKSLWRAGRPPPGQAGTKDWPSQPTIFRRRNRPWPRCPPASDFRASSIWASPHLRRGY